MNVSLVYQLNFYLHVTGVSLRTVYHNLLICFNYPHKRGKPASFKSLMSSALHYAKTIFRHMGKTTRVMCFSINYEPTKIMAPA